MSPKTLTGLELDLDDAPARDSELFLVDGNNLAYRAFFALPEELATTEGFPTNALLGFTNMLFKLLADYKPRGVAVAWDTRPVHIPDFIGLKGDTSDNIPGIPGIGDKTAGQLIAQYGSVESVIEHASELSPARRKNVTEFADQARNAKELATMRRDLDIDCDPPELVLQPPDRAQLRETFRHFEFRNLLNRIDELDAALPAAAPPKIEGTVVHWSEGAVSQGLTPGPVSLAVRDGRFAAASDAGVVVGDWRDDDAVVLRDAQVIAHDFKALPRLTML